MVQENSFECSQNLYENTVPENGRFDDCLFLKIFFQKNRLVCMFSQN